MRVLVSVLRSIGCFNGLCALGATALMCAGDARGQAPTGTPAAFGGGFLGSDAAATATSIRAATIGGDGASPATELLGLDAASGPPPLLTLDEVLQRIDVENPD